MSTTDTSDRMRQGQAPVTGAAGARLRDAKAILSLVPTPRNGLLNPTEALNQSARLTKRLVEVNVTYVWDLAGAVRKHVTGLAGVLKDEVLTTAKVANNQAGKLEEAVIEQADEIQRAERLEARRAKKAARDAAAERYENMTKVELSDELGKRDLAKSGNVDDLRERLIDDDLQTMGQVYSPTT
jgi:hypothetical protein